MKYKKIKKKREEKNKRANTNKFMNQLKHHRRESIGPC